MTTESHIHRVLARFAATTGVPAVGGGIVNAGGEFVFEAMGTCRCGRPELVQRDDAWHIGSCGKSITAALYGRLVEEGLASWGASLTDLIPEIAGDVDPRWRERTIDDVFHCRAGLRANLDLSRMRAAFTDARPLHEQRLEAARWALDRPPRRPGRFVYSNLGYIVAGAVIDRVAGVPFEQALQIHLLDPLGIQSLGTGAPPRIWGHGPRVQLGGLCAFRGRPADPEEPTADNPAVLSSAGTMHLSLDDWARFLRLFVTDGGGVLRPDTISHLLTPPDGRGRPMSMGWVRAHRADGVSFGMQGSNARWSATALLDEDRHRAALVVCNDGRTRVLRRTAYVARELLVA